MRDVPGPTSPAPDEDVLPAQLAQDLHALYPTPRVPATVDAKVLALTQSSAAAFAARRSQAQRRHSSRPLRWVGAGAAAAAVAVVVVVAVTRPGTPPAG